MLSSSLVVMFISVWQNPWLTMTYMEKIYFAIADCYASIECPTELEDLVCMFEKTCGSKAGRLLEKLLFTNMLAKLLCEKNSIQEILRELRLSMSSTLG